MEIRSLEQKFQQQIFEILTQKLSKNPNNCNINQSSYEQDTKESFDFEFFNGDKKMQISCRLRNNGEKNYSFYKDITIRNKSKKNKKTELDKLEEGFGQIYFYGYFINNIIIKWIIIDIDKVRHLLRRNGIQLSNDDGTAFKAYSFQWLKDNGAYIADSSH